MVIRVTMIKNIGLVFASLLLGFFGASIFGHLYNSILQAGFGGGLMGTVSSLEFIVGAPISFVFFLVLLFQLFGDQGKYWWIGIPVLALLAVALYLDPENIFFSVVTILVGAGLGWGIRKVVLSLKKGS